MKFYGYLHAGTNIMETLVVTLEVDMGVILETGSTGEPHFLGEFLLPISSQGHLQEVQDLA
jgi:hypothetical protein